ncbi:MAG TPA: hypothetical protein VG937_32245 [Polyangiaceae bacterium]|nr:hypothetical protein [Polyangiaceae bacterium]
MLHAGRALAADTGNDACPAVALPADDIRDRYDDSARLIHELRIAKGRVVQEIAIAYAGEHAIARTEIAEGHVRIARNYWHADRLLVGECLLDGKRVGYVRYAYDGDGHVTEMDKRTLVASGPGAGSWTRETTRNRYDADGQLIESELRGPDGHLVSATRADRVAPKIPVVISIRAGGAYQSDSALYDFTTGLTVHRDPQVQRYGSDPVEVELDAAYRYHRAAGVTSLDQTTVRFGADYHDLLPRFTLFTFTSMERNLATHLRLYLEEAVLGAKLDVVRTRHFNVDLSFAPIWSFRSIEAPTPSAEDSTSKLRGSFRARAGLRFKSWSLVDTFEFLPTIFGDEFAAEDSFWQRTIVRNTVTFEVNLARHLKLLEVFKYTWDPAMRAQASCPDESNPLCLGYAFSSTTALSVDWSL